MVVEEQPHAQEPGGPQALVMRKDNPQRTDDVRSHPPKHLALQEGLPHEAELEVFEIAQATVHQLRRQGRGAAGQVIHLA